MGKLIPIVLVVSLSGCAVLTTVAAIPSALVDGMVGMFQGQERSLPTSMRMTLVATQQGLRSTRLDVDILQPVKSNYYIAFGNDRLDGILKLTPQTSRLTTLDIKVRRGIEREKSVEKTLMDEIQDASSHVKMWQRFSFKGYGEIFASPHMNAKRIGWFRLQAKLKVNSSRQTGWLSIDMPWGADGYVRGRVKGSIGKKQTIGGL